MYLDNRLRSVVDEIENVGTLIDVGTDHGKVILTALSEGRCANGIASDISKDSLDKARILADRMGIALDTRLGDGLRVLGDTTVDMAVIAGMGGKEIVKILSQYQGKIARLILVPHKDVRLTRRYLVDNGYKLDKDYMVSEGNFYYNIIVASVGHEILSTQNEYLGKNTLDNDTFRSYLDYRANVIEKILKNTSNDELSKELDIIKNYL